jgi:hypothetical protein
MGDIIMGDTSTEGPSSTDDTPYAASETHSNDDDNSTHGSGDNGDDDMKPGEAPATFDPKMTASDHSDNPVDKFRTDNYKDAKVPSIPGDAVPNDDQIKNLPTYPPDDKDPDADHIQFQSNGTAIIWSKDPDKDVKTEGGTWGASGFVDQKGVVHYFNDTQYEHVNDGKHNTAWEVTNGKTKYDTSMNAKTDKL